eukprot:350255-Chlamydomonas_euryale.AAC.28
MAPSALSVVQASGPGWRRPAAWIPQLKSGTAVLAIAASQVVVSLCLLAIYEGKNGATREERQSCAPMPQSSLADFRRCRMPVQVTRHTSTTHGCHCQSKTSKQLMATPSCQSPQIWNPR